MQPKKMSLPTAIAELERALAEAVGAARTERAMRLPLALADLEEAIQRHLRAMQAPDGLIGKMDRPRLPSPTVDRGTEHLRAELVRFLQDIDTLRLNIRAGVAAEQGAFFRRARELAAALERYEDREADLILESVNMDIGAPD
jgi:hypothetical protein